MRPRSNMRSVRQSPALLCIALLAAAWMPGAYALNPWVDTRHPRESVTVDYLYESCSVVGETAYGQIAFFDCESYVYGVLDGYLSIRDSIPKASRACFPATLPPWKALQQAEPLIAEKQGSNIAAPVLIEALRKQYPCK